MSCGSVSRHGEVAGRRGLSVRLLRLPSFCYSTCLFLKGFISGLRAGNYELEEQIKAGMTPEQIKATWQPGLDSFKQVRKKYLMYPDFE